MVDAGCTVVTDPVPAVEVSCAATSANTVVSATKKCRILPLCTSEERRWYQQSKATTRTKAAVKRVQKNVAQGINEKIWSSAELRAQRELQDLRQPSTKPNTSLSGRRIPQRRRHAGVADCRYSESGIEATVPGANKSAGESQKLVILVDLESSPCLTGSDQCAMLVPIRLAIQYGVLEPVHNDFRIHGLRLLEASTLERNRHKYHKQSRDGPSLEPW